MKFAKYVALTALLSVACVAGAKEKRVPRIYMYGLSASFADSTVYFTNVQAVDSAWMDTKKSILLGRDNYSLQLKNMLAEKHGERNRTCIVVFGTKKSRVEKDLLKMRRKYTVKANNQYNVRYIDDADFHFKPVDMSYETTDAAPAE